ncbi:unnamed protein product [Pedinophyceae sp. YPF-701]|nr:unnamed protein product [Pedinophyceae sp. YPF-701]
MEEVEEQLRKQLEKALEIKDENPQRSMADLEAVIHSGGPDQKLTPEIIKVKEGAITSLAELCATTGQADKLKSLLSTLRPLFVGLPKAKTAKLVRIIIDCVSRIPGTRDLQVDICREQVEWCRAEKRAFLRQRIEVRLAQLYLDSKEFQAALALISSLLSEVKRLDDKLLLVDIHLIESRVHHLLRNVPKAKAALTAGRTAANAVYTPPLLQADIDMQSGTLHTEEKDYKTAYSYFFEAFEAFASLKDPRAQRALKYMLLSKVMMGASDEVQNLIATKSTAKLAGRELDAVAEVARAHRERSLAHFEKALAEYATELRGDPLVSGQTQELYDKLLEQNLQRITEPYSRVEVAHVAGLIGLPVDLVEARLAQMILDGKLVGTLDAGSGCLELFDASGEDPVYTDALTVFSSLGKVVDTLFERSRKIVA